MDPLCPQPTLPTLPHLPVWAPWGHCDYQSLSLLNSHLLFIQAHPSRDLTERGELDGFNELITVPKTPSQTFPCLQPERCHLICSSDKHLLSIYYVPGPKDTWEGREIRKQGR